MKAVCNHKVTLHKMCKKFYYIMQKPVIEEYIFFLSLVLER